MRFLLLILACILVHAHANGQGKIAVHGGAGKVLNAKAVIETPYNDEKFPVGPAFGISYLRNSTKQVSFFAKAGFITKGFLRQTAMPDNSYYTKIRINYLYIAPQVFFNFLAIKSSRLSLTGGFYMAAPLSGKESGIWSSIGGPRSYNSKIIFGNSKDKSTGQVMISNFDFGINSSLIYQRSNFGIMLNWQGGLRTVNTYIPYAELNKKYRNNTIEISLFYQFDIGKHKMKKSSITCPPVQ